jgi:hypothetical protein
MWIGFIWLRIGTSEGLLSNGNELLGLILGEGIS